MKGYYGHKYDTADSRKYYGPVVIALLMILIGIVGRCEMQEELPSLTPAQKAEIMGRQVTAFEREQHIYLADRIFAGRVEQAWRERAWRLTE